MSAAKAAAQRKRDERQRHRDAGRVAVTVYVRPEWRGKVRELEDELRKLSLLNVDQPPLLVASTDCLGPLVEPAAWQYWHKVDSLKRATVTARMDATLSGADEYAEIPLYALTPDDVAAVNAARKEVASKARRLDLCKCDHNEYCPHCLPAEFRAGGVWARV